MSSRRLRPVAVVAVPVLGALVALGTPGLQGNASPSVDPVVELGAVDPITEHVPSADDRYSVATGCFSIFSSDAGAHLRRTADGFVADADASAASAFRFQPFDLGKYLLVADDGSYLAAEGGPVETADHASHDAGERLPHRHGSHVTKGYVDDAPAVTIPNPVTPSTRTGAVAAAPEPSALAEWIVRDADGGGLTLHLQVDDHDEGQPGPSDVAGTAPTAGDLIAAADGTLAVADDGASTFEARPATGCAEWAEVALNVDGVAPAGDNRVDEVTGYIDAHLHMMAFEFIGGRSRCARPWHPYGVERALVDCPDHEPGGAGAALEAVLSGATTHATDGWPTFSYWPKYDSLTHEQVYYRWMERAWRGGLRTFTNLLVDNNALCEVWIHKHNSCNEMDGVRLQAERLRQLERYIDAHWGGPGKGWFRIVTDPFQARQTIQEGRLAVVMGIEVSVLFDCGIVMGVPQCDEDDIDRQLAEVWDLGVRQMELANKFDNALTGVTGDNGSTGVIVNFGNFADTGQWWQMETCGEDAHPHQHDKHQHNFNDDSGGHFGPLTERDGIFGAVLQVSGRSGVAPVYPEGPHCNVRGLTDLGRHLLDRMVERGMMFDPDHMSTKARQEALDHLEAKGYSGVLSSHSWSDPTVYERILEMGGIVTPYAGDAQGFVQKWRDTRGWADDRYLFGIGYGADTNGFGSQGGPRNPAPGEGVEYPFTGFGGITVDRQISGVQTYDINTDGVDHYGLYPDWLEDIRVQLGAEGDDFLAEMGRGPEAYLQMWERALGIANDACRDSRVTPASAAAVASITPGMTAEQVLVTLGQPAERSSGTFRHCTAVGNVEVAFDSTGKVTGVTTGA